MVERSVLVSCLTVAAALVAAAQANKEFNYCDPGSCPEGHFYDPQSPKDGQSCLPCPDEHYQDLRDHRCTDCFRCHKADLIHEILVKNCTSTSNAVIRCEEGYFWVPDGDPRLKGFCEKCGLCLDGRFVVSNCTEDSDTVCSSLDNEKVPQDRGNGTKMHDAGMTSYDGKKNGNHTGRCNFQLLDYFFIAFFCFCYHLIY